MLLSCANSNCPAEFLYLYQGQLFLLELPNRTVERYWLCEACAQSMRVVYEPAEGIKIIQRDAVRNPRKTDPRPEAA